MAFLSKMAFFCVAVLLMQGVGVAGESASMAGVEDEAENARWQEAAWEMPAFPQADALVPFYVSAATSNRFFVDAASLKVTDDGVVRYTLLVLTPEGGRNVGFEGMRCETRERRLYASGRSDGTWSMSRNKRWFPVLDAASNRQYMALFVDYFCPGGVIVRDAEEAVLRLKRDSAFVGRLQ